MESTRYVITFILILTSIVALALAGLTEVTKKQAKLNEEIFNKRAIMLAIEDYLPDNKKEDDFSDEEVVELFGSKVEQLVIDVEGNIVEGKLADEVDMAKERKKDDAVREWPLYIYTSGSEKYYILSVRGSGLWDEIWGYIALAPDLNTVVGTAFDHKAETPGLGAEIKDNPSFPKSFVGKKIFDDNGAYVSVEVRKGGALAGNMHQVDGLTGATVTGNGVSDMMYDGIQYYLPYLEEL